MADLLPGYLRPGALVLIDTAALVYLIEGSGPRRHAVEAFLASAREHGLRMAASAIVWTELFDGAFSRADGELQRRYRILLSDSEGLFLAPVDAAIAEEAARLIAGSKRGAPALDRSAQRPPGRALALADALHIATAIVLGAAAVLGNDEAWRLVPSCPPLLLVDELAFEIEA